MTARPVAAIAFCLMLRAEAQPRFTFAHPGLLHSRQDLERMKRSVAGRQEPVFAGYERLRVHPQSRADYVMQGPFEEIGRNPNLHFREFDQDANAAYQNALLWAATGDQAHAIKAKAILDAWSGALRRVSGADAVLMVGLGPFKMVNAAEILRHSGSGWPDANAERFGQLCRNVFYPVLENFAEFANGNWDTAAVKTMLAMGVYLDDRAMFERALRYYVDGAGNGRLTHYIYQSGQCQESGRDQQHTQLGLGHLGDASEIAWQQGLDLYSYAAGRLLAGFEYTARYNLGNAVPFDADLDRTGKNAHQRISPPSSFRPVFEQIYNHFVKRAGVDAPFTEQAAARLRPEGAAQGADHPGFGTLLFSRGTRGRDPDEALRPGAPAGLVARGTDREVRLTWIAARGTPSYTVKRAEGTVGPWRVMADGLRACIYEDRNVNRGVVYRYTVAAHNGPQSVQIEAAAGLPSRWEHRDIGDQVQGAAFFDGDVWRIEAGGPGIGGAPEGFHFASIPLEGDGEITARYLPQVASQFATFGLMLRSGFDSGASQVALLIAPTPGARGRGEWQTRVAVRSPVGQETTVAGMEADLRAPYVAYGRLMRPYWLRLQRRGATITALSSPDGRSWSKTAEAEVPLSGGVRAGLAVSSALGKVPASVRFDHVSVIGSTPH